MAQTSFHRLLIANRGEVAARIARTCDRLGIEPVFVASVADSHAPYLQDRRVVILGPGAPAKSYLDINKVVQAGVQTHCSAVHPGWGFLAENPRFAALCEAHGMTFIGPTPGVMQLMGKKSPAKKAMGKAGLALIPGSDGPLRDAGHAREVAEHVGFPVLLKAESGGGGRGMRIANSNDEVADAFGQASAEALAAFGDPRMYLEKLIIGGRHVEVQILADRYGNAVHLGERDCSVQRNHQKLIEESPATAIDPAKRAATLDAAVRATQQIGYVGAGTMEFLVGDDGTPRFMEMNTRLQVEHCVSEMRTGIDLVEQQIRVAAGEALAFTQEDIEFSGHAIECRINAENPEDGFRPSPGTLDTWSPPKAGDDLRVDTHVESGYAIPTFYDSLLCKIIALGSDRNAAIDRMLTALGEFAVDGVHTTVSMHSAILDSRAFRDNDYDTTAIPGWPKP